MERVEKRRTHVTARIQIQQRICPQEARLRQTHRSSKYRPALVLLSQDMSYVIRFTEITSSQFSTSSVWAPCSLARVRPRSTYTTAGCERSRALRACLRRASVQLPAGAELRIAAHAQRAGSALLRGGSQPPPSNLEPWHPLRAVDRLWIVIFPLEFGIARLFCDSW